MRGIVILEVLRQVQSELGKIHVQDFFDLIVGTRLVSISCRKQSKNMCFIADVGTVLEASWHSLLASKTGLWIAV